MPLRTDLEPKEYLDIILRRKWVIIFSILFVICMSLFILIITPVMFKSYTTVLIIPQRVPDAYVRSTASGWIEDRLATLGPLVMSRTRLLKVIDEYGVFKGKQKHIRPPEDIMVELMRKKIELSVDTRNDSFTLSFAHQDPMTAMLVTKRLASFFMEENLKMRERQAEETSEFLVTHMKEAKEKSEAQEEKLRQYKYRYLDELPGQADVLLRNIKGFQIEYKNLNDRLRLAEERKANLEIRNQSLNKTLSSILADNTTSYTSESSDETSDMAQPPQTLTELDRKQARLAELSQKYTDSFPEIQQLKVEIRQLEERLHYPKKQDSTIKTDNRKFNLNRFYQRLLAPESEEKLFVREEISKAEKEIGALKKELKGVQENINKSQEKLSNTPMREQEYVALTRDFENHRRVFEELKRKKLDLDLGEAIEKTQEQARFQILDPANLPTSPFSPDVSRIFKFALLGGIALGFGGALGLEALDTKIRGTKDFKYYCQIPILAILPVIKGREYSRRMRMNKMAIAGGLFSFIIAISILLIVYSLKTNKISLFWGS